MVVHTCQPSIVEVDVEGSGVPGRPQLDSEFKASLGHMRLSQKHKIKKDGVFIIELIANYVVWLPDHSS